LQSYRRSSSRASVGHVWKPSSIPDVGLRITGSDLDDLFRTAAKGFFDYIVVNRDDVRVRTRAAID